MKRKELARRWQRLKEEVRQEQIGICTDGRGQVILSGCRALIGYTEEEVSVLTDEGRMIVRGEGLTLRAFHTNRILVKGRWHEIRWEDEK